MSVSQGGGGLSVGTDRAQGTGAALCCAGVEGGDCQTRVRQADEWPLSDVREAFIPSYKGVVNSPGESTAEA